MSYVSFFQLSSGRPTVMTIPEERETMEEICPAVTPTTVTYDGDTEVTFNNHDHNGAGEEIAAPGTINDRGGETQIFQNQSLMKDVAVISNGNERNGDSKLPREELTLLKNDEV